MLDSLKKLFKSKKQKDTRLHRQFLDIQKWQREMYDFKSRQEKEIH